MNLEIVYDEGLHTVYAISNVKKDLYSIRHPESKKNVRVIYTIIEDAVILLTAFLENNDGDYRRAISVAKKRLNWLQKD